MKDFYGKKIKTPSLTGSQITEGTLATPVVRKGKEITPQLYCMPISSGGFDLPIFVDTLSETPSDPDINVRGMFLFDQIRN